MYLRHIIVGMIETNCYLCGADDSDACVVIDPGDEAESILYAAHVDNKKIAAVLLTHGHYDHIGAISGLRKALASKKSTDPQKPEYEPNEGFKVYALKAEEQVITNPAVNLSLKHNFPFAEKADVYLDDGDAFTLAGLEFKIISTPGHTIGSSCYYVEKENVLFSGDTLFQMSVGRTDFPTSSTRMLVESVRNRLFTLPDNTMVYPGHGPETDIYFEKHNNYYV